jgi:hypothetical protein
VIAETGATRDSVANVKEILVQKGVPDQIRLWFDPDRHWQVEAIWKKPRHRHLFEGFSWGYWGEGPAGLLFLLDAVGSKVTKKDIATWPERFGFPGGIRHGSGPKEWSPRSPAYKVFEKDLDYGKDWV